MAKTPSEPMKIGKTERRFATNSLTTAHGPNRTSMNKKVWYSAKIGPERPSHRETLLTMELAVRRILPRS
ncbi:hypothetical protein NECAME_17425 [Necator americanus]|uniref:Uncharacterized protein n=1 Tax=Necator americanus TaxID=51031 RepID=W2TPE9_NECAM|nr:hypothetical protein NECAME_17425 [Necator americanus]ETN83564.1 hypothetical protein NECAME_17425 [Necator americanus]